MATPRIEVTGVQPLRQAIRQAKDVELTKAFKDAGSEGAEEVAYTAQTIVPVVSARLMESIRASGTMAGGIVRAGSSRVRWAGPIHFGHPARNIPPDPFLYHAADRRAADVTEIYYKRIEDLTQEIARRSAI